MRKGLLVVGVLLMGLEVQVKAAGHRVPGSSFETGWEFRVDMPVVALGVYTVCLLVTLHRLLDQMPGVFGLHSPLGTVHSKYGFLWAPAIVSILVGFSSTWPLASPADESSRTLSVRYGQFTESGLHMAAFGVFALLLLTLKFRSAMAQANRLLAARGQA